MKDPWLVYVIVKYVILFGLLGAFVSCQTINDMNARAARLSTPEGCATFCKEYGSDFWFITGAPFSNMQTCGCGGKVK